MEEISNPYFVVEAYRKGYFPMAQSKYGKVYWHSPNPRAIIPLENVKTPKNIRKKINRGEFKFSVNNNFDYVIRKCADRKFTWINKQIIRTYNEIHNLGFANSVETWKNDEIVGGLYGVTIGGAFFGESMFNDVSDASKASFYYLIERLIKNEFILLDSQYINPFTEQLGAIEIPRNMYLSVLKKAIELPRIFH